MPPPSGHRERAATARLKGWGVCQFAGLIQGGELKIAPLVASAHWLELDTRPLHAPMHRYVRAPTLPVQDVVASTLDAITGWRT
jgi:hypothetical protein